MMSKPQMVPVGRTLRSWWCFSLSWALGVGLGTLLRLIAEGLDSGDWDRDCGDCAFPSGCVWLNHHAILVLVGLVTVIGLLWIHRLRRRHGKACRVV